MRSQDTRIMKYFGAHGITSSTVPRVMAGPGLVRLITSRISWEFEIFNQKSGRPLSLYVLANGGVLGQLNIF